MLTEAKVTLTGTLSVVDRYCGCCTSKNMINLLDEEGRPVWYCNDCFNTNCQCGSIKIITVEK